MTALITVCEYALLTTEPVTPSLRQAQVPASAFDWLCDLSARVNNGTAQLLHVEGRRSLRWNSYVGVVETPCGTRLEILPKHVVQDESVASSRALLRKLVQAALSLKPRQASVTGLERFDAPLSEWVMAQFLVELDRLLKRGLRFDYQRIEEEARFLRGQLDMVAQLRQPPGRQHYFRIRHDVFLPDRAENRLLKLALEHVAALTRDAGNWRLASELRARMVDVPASSQVDSDFSAWRHDRLMAHYQAIESWCSLILNQQMPLAVAGEWQGMSLLFPMEKLFERYVEGCLRRQLLPGARLTAQAASEYLCRQNQKSMFRLQPDMLVSKSEQRWILDAKWKLLDQEDGDHRYGLSQSDFYQLFAYGQKYLGGEGEMVLVYPKWEKFSQILSPFNFNDALRLWVLPFDLERDVMLGVEQTTLGRDCLKVSSRLIMPEPA